ncbi:MAG TPA: hypothetical protein VF024_11170 [Solirubrobacteraceae bacterium]
MAEQAYGPRPDSGIDVERLRAALRTEMGWSDYEVDEFLADHALSTPRTETSE